MKKINLIFMAFVALALTFSACSSGGDSGGDSGGGNNNSGSISSSSGDGGACEEIPVKVGTIGSWYETACACGSETYDPEEAGCRDGIIMLKCSDELYDPATQVCSFGTVKNKCGYNSYFPESEVCKDGIVMHKCGDDGSYFPEFEVCKDGIVMHKCGDELYDPRSELICTSINDGPFMVVAECGSKYYSPADATQRCQNGVLEEKCGTGWYYPPTQACEEGVVLYKCGGEAYDQATHSCCNNNLYSTATQFCYDNRYVGNKCGTRTEIFNPNSYECRDGNKIYLKEPISIVNGGNTYQAVMIGNQTWLASNVGDNVNFGVCHSSGCEYGMLYPWAYAPCGNWRVPSDDDWNALIAAVQSPEGYYLKSTTGWTNENGLDTYGFAAKPGGQGTYGSSNNTYSQYGTTGAWWSSTGEQASNGNGNYFYINNNYLSKSAAPKNNYRSVRCVRDNL